MSDIIGTTELSTDARAELETRMRELLVSSADWHAIQTADDFAGAGECLRAGKTLLKRIEDEFDTPIKAAHAAHKAICAMREKFTGPVKVECERLNRIMSNYTAAEQARVRAEQQRLVQEARKRAEDARLAAALELERQGQQAAAVAALNAPIIVTAPRVVTPPPKADGVSVRTTWRYEVIDVALVPLEYMVPDDTKLTNYARTMRDTATMPGVKFYPVQSMSARRF